MNLRWQSCLTDGGERRERGPPMPSVGEEVTGKVTRIVGYGVFLDLDKGGRAMLHVDEVAVKPEDEGKEPNVRALFKEGDALTVRGLALVLHGQGLVGSNQRVQGKSG